MSFRLFTNRLFNHGRFIIKHYCKRDIHINILENKRNRTVPISVKKASQLQTQNIVRNPGILRFGQHARKLFVDNILNRVTTTYSSDLRAQATKKFLYGDSAPFFALIGVSLASGTGVLTKDDELEGVCWEIREAVSRLQNIWGGDEVTKNIREDFGLKDLNIGEPIAKGCAAVVYKAALKNPEKYNFDSNAPPVNLNNENLHSTPKQRLSPALNHRHNFNSFGGSVDNLNVNSFNIPSRALDYEMMFQFRDRINSTGSVRQRFGSLSEQDFVVATEDITTKNNDAEGLNNVKSAKIDTNLNEYPLALKMMFNYDIQSNAMSILRAMYKETVPARQRKNPDAENWEKILSDQIVDLPAHPNIVLMFGVFCAEIPDLINSISLYPMALPTRINPHGYGRNMSLFLLMKRYKCSLRDYLLMNDVDTRISILLFAQLLEAVVHLYRYGVAHRDLKTDNILIDINVDSPPTLVLSDFGCCLADKTNGLLLPYTSSDIDKGGNTALMAPEIILKEPGKFSVLNYSKSDMWTCGAIAYEIFGQHNPFYETSQDKKQQTAQRNFDYNEANLPELPNNVPFIVRKLVENILQKNPNKRLNPDVAANVIQLYLWAPSNWLKSSSIPSSTEILQWLLSLTTKVLCESRLGGNSSNNPLNFNSGRRTYTEYLLISSFLARARLSRIRRALNWIQDLA